MTKTTPQLTGREEFSSADLTLIEATARAAESDEIERLAAYAQRLQLENAALREQLADTERERNAYRGQLVGLNTQLAQVTSERDAVRDLCVEKVKAVLAQEAEQWKHGQPKNDLERGVRAGLQYALEAIESLENPRRRT